MPPITQPALTPERLQQLADNIDIALYQKGHARLSPEAAWTVKEALHRWARELTPAPEPYVPPGPIERLNFQINEWGPSGQNMMEVLAKANHLDLAKAAYEAAKIAYPGRRITLQNRALVIKSSWRV